MMRGMRSFLILLVMLAPLVGFGQADSTQSDGPSSFGDRLVYGGNLGLSLGNVTVIDVSPTVGYKVTEKFIVGPGATYLYYNDNITQFRASVYGGRLFGQYLINRYLFAYGEMEVLNGEFDQFEPSKRINVVSPLAGAGFYQSLGGFGYSFTVLWNFNDSRFSPHPSNPVIRGGFNIGL